MSAEWTAIERPNQFDVGIYHNGVHVGDVNQRDFPLRWLFTLMGEVNESATLRTALEEIAKHEGAFSRDPLTHAQNVILNMMNIALNALGKETQDELE
jgi:hypothetical protein